METLTDATSAVDICPGCKHEVGDAWLVCAWCGRQLAAPAELPVGAELAGGRYRIDGILGRGGFGITYEGFDSRLERRVAIKELFPSSAVRHGSTVLTPPAERLAFAAARERFMREARVLARFTHPGVVRVFEVFEEHATAYLVMELIEGRTLVEVLQAHGRPLPTDDLLDLAGRVAAALRPLHAAGVLHRDVNPSNLMLTHHGRVVVIDFGMARDVEVGAAAPMTRVVTPGYAPLEQYMGEGQFGPPTDVYGLAATMYRLATGRVPTSALDRSGGAELVAPARINPDLPKAVSDAILDGLELDPSHRPADLDSFLARLGVDRLPEGPRARLIDTVPPASSTTASQPQDTPGDDPAPPGVSGLHTVVDPALRPPSAPSPAVDATRALATPWSPPSADLTAHHASPPFDQTRHEVRGPRSDARIDSDLRPHLGGPPPAYQALPAGSGRGRRTRRRVTLPLFALALGLGGAAPVVTCGLMTVVVLPLLATRGDSVAHRLRVMHGVADGWAEQRMGPGALAPVRFVRNVVVSVVRALPVLGLGAVLTAGWYGIEQLDVSRGVSDAALRAVGMVTAAGLAWSAREGSRRFRTGLALDALAEWLAPTGGLSQPLVVFWLVSTALVAGSFWLEPWRFPLG